MSKLSRESRPLAWKTWLARLALVAGSVVAALGAVELLVAGRLVPMSPAAALYVHGCYEPSQPGRSIFASSPLLKLGIHRPDFESDCYALGGHTWRHRSDGWGWRNPETWQSADVVLLGDSMVYGHGVEERQTAAHFLREILGRRVVNMGMRGASPVHYLAYLNNFALPLKPSVVVVLTFGNDLTDIRATRPMAKILRFVRTGKGREAKVYARAELLGRLRYSPHRPAWYDRFALARLAEFHLRAWDHRRKTAAAEPLRPPTAASARQTRGPATAGRRPSRLRALARMNRLPTTRYLRRAASTMAEASREAGAALVLGHIGQRTHTDWAVRRVLREVSGEQGAHYFNVPELVGTYRLPTDGHYNEAGHRALAEALAAFLDERGLFEPDTP